MRTERTFCNPTRSNRAWIITLWAVLAIILALAAAIPAQAGEGRWSLRLEPIQMEVYGHDQHVLTIHEIDIVPDLVDNQTGVTLDTESNLAYRSELQYNRDQWGWGVDFFWFNTSQVVADQSAAGGSGTADIVVFEIAGQSFISFGPSEVLAFEVLEDTDVAAWTVDFYARRRLAERPGADFYLQFGLRVGDFDNDYRAIVGYRDTGGARLDSSSNYGLMVGPLVGLAGELSRGKNRVDGYIGQSLLLGSAELTRRTRLFRGPLSDARPTEVDLEGVFAREIFRADQDAAIPITELRLRWTYQVSRLLALGLGVNTSAWWDVPVPPGAIPGETGAQTLHENTLVFFGLAGAIELTF